jgi:hypothetical protein
MTDLEMLFAIEGIRKTKATYWYGLDTKRWDLVASAFTEDAIVDFRGGRDLKVGEDHDRLQPLEQALAEGDGMVVKGAAAIANFMREGVAAWVTVHHGANPVIEITAADTAAVIWPFFDLLDNGETVQRGYGHYHESYRYDGMAWRIHRMRVTRLRIDGDHPLHGPRDRP